MVTRLELDPGPPSHMDRRLEQQSLRRGLYYFDTRASFAGEPPSAFWIYELDPHPNARAHRIFADALFDWQAQSPIIRPIGMSDADFEQVYGLVEKIRAEYERRQSRLAEETHTETQKAQKTANAVNLFLTLI